MVYFVLGFLALIFGLVVAAIVTIIPAQRRDLAEIKRLKDAKELKMRQEAEARNGDV